MEFLIYACIEFLVIGQFEFNHVGENNRPWSFFISFMACKLTLKQQPCTSPVPTLGIPWVLLAFFSVKPSRNPRKTQAIPKQIVCFPFKTDAFGCIWMHLDANEALCRK
jgi:hypothetical protein